MPGKYEKRSEAMRKRWADPAYRAAQVKILRTLAQDVERNDAIREMRRKESIDNVPLVQRRIRALGKAGKKAHQRCKARNYRRKWSWGPTKRSLAMKKLWATKREQMLTGLNKSWDERRRNAHSVAMNGQSRTDNLRWSKKEPAKQPKTAPPEVLAIFDELCERVGCNASASIGFEPKQIHRNDSPAPVIATLGAALCASTPIKLEKTSGDYGKTKKPEEWQGSVAVSRKQNKKDHPWHQQQRRECESRKAGK